VSTLADVIDQVAQGAAAAHDELNRLDAAAGDGDLGNTVTLAAQAVRASIRADRDASPAALLRRCGTDVATSAPSTSGTLTARALLAAGRAVDSADQGQPPVAVVAVAFEAALAAIQKAGKAAPGDRTMLDALAPAVAELTSQAQAGATTPVGVGAAAGPPRHGAEATADMTPRAGRARWLAERSKGTQDAGAHLVAVVLALAADALA
jgi:dihydroxyacetone kinase